mmetsp:Transcript_50957/g.84460  ORF Transcript_50957/g.84460 Transcript_50957/m.84460 type:complete len:279 (+) Transcript_50957:1073-1909(+)
MLRDIEELNVERLNELATDFGAFQQSQLFVGTHATSGACSTLHFDQQDNLFLQIAGRKKFRIYDPEEAGNLYAWPVHHPLDRRAQVDLSKAEAAGGHDPDFPRLARARAREIILEPGDLLFLPGYWWHEVTTLPVPAGELVVSVNFWYKIDWNVHLTRLPLRSTFLLEAVRQIEMLVAETFESPRLIPAFLRAAGRQMHVLRQTPRGSLAQFAASNAGSVWQELHAQRPREVPHAKWEGLFEFLAWKSILLVGADKALTLLEDLCDASRFECIEAPAS